MANYQKGRKLSIALKASFGTLLVSLLLSAPALADLIGPTLPGIADRRSAPGVDTTFVQTSLDTPGQVASAPTAGTITGFNMRIGTVYNAGSTIQFWVLRPIAGGYAPVASSAAQTVQANALNHVTASIPVAAGDRIGLSEPAANDFETPNIDSQGGSNTWFNGIPTVGVALTGGTNQVNNVFPFNADFTPAGGGSTPPGTAPPDTTAPDINLTSPGKKRTYRRLKSISLTTEAGASVKLALLRCVGRKCPKSAKAAKKSKKGKGKSKVMHSVSLSSSGKGTFKLAGKLRGRKNRKGLAKPGKYVLYVQATDAAGNSAVTTKKFGIKSSKKKKKKSS